MSQEHPTNTATVLKSRRWKTDDVFYMLSYPFRRRVILSLASRGPQTAVDLNAASGMERHTYLKHFSALVEAGLLVQKDNPDDGRKPFYDLSPAAVVCRTKDGLTVNFGCCLLRQAVSRNRLMG